MSRTKGLACLSGWKKRSTLMHAILRNDIHEVEMLLDLGYDVDTCFFYGQYEKPAVCLCLEKRFVGIAKLFVDRGCSLSLRTGTGLTPLHIAVSLGPAEFVQYLIQNRANVNAQCENLENPLHLACANSSSGAMAIVKMLCEAKTSINVVCFDGRTPLMVACSNGHIDIAMYLIAKGALVNFVDSHGYSALMYTISNFHPPVLVKALLEKGAQVFDEYHDNLLTTFLKAVVMYQRKHMRNEEYSVCILKLLIDAGCDINRSDASGQNALHIAAISRQAKLVQTVLNAGCSVSVADNLGNTGLFYACRGGNEASVRLILQAGVDRRLETEWLQNEEQAPVCNAGLVRICIAELARLLRLSEICRLVIRAALAPNIEQRVASLEIPQLLKDFILFNH